MSNEVCSKESHTPCLKVGGFDESMRKHEKASESFIKQKKAWESCGEVLKQYLMRIFKTIFDDRMRKVKKV